MVPTKKSVLWGIVNSWWILLTFTFLFTSFAFLFISLKVNHRKWTIWGCIYGILLILPFLSFEVFNEDQWQSDILLMLGLFVWIFSIVHAFRIRKEYLLRLEVLQSINQDKEQRLRGQIESEYGVKRKQSQGKQVPRMVAQQETRQTTWSSEEQSICQVSTIDQQQTPNHEKTTEMNITPNGNLQDVTLVGQVKEQGRIAPKSAVDVQSSLEPPQIQSAEPLLDLNAATEKELAQLPGVGFILAKRAISERTKNGGFRTFEEFTEVLNLKPHNIEKISLLAIVKAPESAAPQTAGRMVDF
ncbi:ComEA family DNA-binding protein [Bacillus sp. EB01]|uniref:ComEA family DNA-binding protein n=1 Tax=Bacillus sp. EB01 TaxID=1347086 RepID=UPI0005C52B14|nr:helix-hairpin-helix domain-containing protein [Bacillus sp. EB01]